MPKWEHTHEFTEVEYVNEREMSITRANENLGYPPTVYIDIPPQGVSVKVDPLTEGERAAFELSGDLWNAFIALPVLHTSDTDEFRAHIHALQNIIMSRPVMRYEGRNK
ncbi:hypothetical protein KC887_04925 [Candidatus Kaiserbacteria bacterium]|nr:hypothetical protein [Candidatus Kaiserbacteria bacterium]